MSLYRILMLIMLSSFYNYNVFSMLGPTYVFLRSLFNSSEKIDKEKKQSSFSETRNFEGWFESESDDDKEPSSETWKQIELNKATIIDVSTQIKSYVASAKSDIKVKSFFDNLKKDSFNPKAALESIYEEKEYRFLNCFLNILDKPYINAGDVYKTTNREFVQHQLGAMLALDKMIKNDSTTINQTEIESYIFPQHFYEKNLEDDDLLYLRRKLEITICSNLRILRKMIESLKNIISRQLQKNSILQSFLEEKLFYYLNFECYEPGLFLASIIYEAHYDERLQEFTEEISKQDHPRFYVFQGVPFSGRGKISPNPKAWEYLKNRFVSTPNTNIELKCRYLSETLCILNFINENLKEWSSHSWAKAN